MLRRLSREDQYMDEGLWHVRRNLAEAADAGQRAGAEAAAANRGPFISQAEPYPIYTFPRWWLWSAALTLAAAPGSWPQRPQRTQS